MEKDSNYGTILADMICHMIWRQQLYIIMI